MSCRRACVAATALAGCVSPPAGPPPAPNATAEGIVRGIYAAAGGESWRRPTTLVMRGHGDFATSDVPHERHVMWRVYESAKTDGRAADGKVRILSVRAGEPVIDVAFDGITTSTRDGPQPKSEADRRWASNFGFGVIRHALDDGYRVEIVQADTEEGRPTDTLRVTDPAGGETLFWVERDTHRILKIGFDTERGWHERRYSDFFSKTGTDWVQPGRVRLYYDGVLANTITWTDFETGVDIPDCVFVLPEAEGCPDGI